MLSRLVLILSLAIGTSAWGGNSNKKKPQAAEALKTVVISGPITGQSLAPIYSYFSEILSKVNSESKLRIVINSPGGSVVAGFLLLDRLAALKQRGVHVECHVAEVAASMAFQILLKCDERYALDTSFLLWHRARVFLGGMFGAALTGPEMYALGVQLKDLDDHIYGDVRTGMPSVTDKFTRFHFERETLHTGSNLVRSAPDFISIDREVSWVMEQLSNSDAVHSARGGFFDGLTFGELIYVWDRVLTTEAISGQGK